MSWTKATLPALSGKTFVVTGGNSGRAWPLVLAAADPGAEAGTCYGPTGMGGARGKVGRSAVDDRARDQAVAEARWEKTEALVGPFFG